MVAGLPLTVIVAMPDNSKSIRQPRDIDIDESDMVGVGAPSVGIEIPVVFLKTQPSDSSMFKAAVKLPCSSLSL